MTYEERLENVAVLGAAGKMGSGILLLTAVHMADLQLQNKDKTYVLYAIDVSNKALTGLMDYLRVQVRKIAEKKINWIRGIYAEREDLVENTEMIDEYIFDVMKVVRPIDVMEAAYKANLVFEAVNENKDLKVKLFTQIKENNPNDVWFFTNTSSVPIHYLEDNANLKGRIIGFHFYNPPAIQKLVELIKTENTTPELEQFARDYAKNLKKIIVPSNDFAGFIGNGHFMRDALFGINEALALAKEKNIPLPQAIYMINKITQDYLVRPMGIFQLMDYVGIDVMQFIMNVMNPYLKDEDLHSDLLDTMIAQDIKGGQYSSGAQKDGFLKYEKGKIVAVYDPNKKAYINIDEFAADADKMLGKIPDSAVTWKATLRIKNKDEVFTKFFNDLKDSDTLGAKLAVKYALNSKAIGEKLVADGVANNADDVNTVMLTGFYHAYGPINNYFE
jgi:3-hydroxyacyl-CoA dehydrogenase